MLLKSWINAMVKDGGALATSQKNSNHCEATVVSRSAPETMSKRLKK
jgi:hypothetical protein